MRALWGVGLLTFLAILIRNAWVAEDAYVTFRALDNLLLGHGLRWNIAERVQAFSNPLWLFALVPFFWLFSNPYPAALMLSMILSFGVAGLCALRGARTKAAGLLGLVALCCSRSFIDYSTSGLENPLSHLLITLFMIGYWEKSTRRRRLLTLASLTSLAAVNRLDTLLFYLPALSLVFLQTRGRHKTSILLCGLLPLVAWEAFSLLYYGFLFPNTAYAKLNMGHPKHEVLAQGGIYYLDLLSNDPFSFVIIFLSFLTPLLLPDRRLLAPLCGLASYLVYIVWIGGDFMSGRFFSTPVLVAVLLLVRLPLRDFRVAWGGALLFVTLSFLSPTPPLTSGYEAEVAHFSATGVADERRYYYPGAGLLRIHRLGRFPDNWLVSDGVRDEKLAKKREGLLVVQRINIGFHGYEAGPRVHVIDPLALADPLLARLPAAFDPKWRVGHYDRVVPNGYKEVLESRRTQSERPPTDPSRVRYTRHARLSDASLNEYYQVLSLITRGPLWEKDRLRAIWDFNLGEYQHLVDEQRYRFADPKSDRDPLRWQDSYVASKGQLLDRAERSEGRFPGQSLLIQSSQELRMERFSLRYASPIGARLYFLRGTEVLGFVDLDAAPQAQGRIETIQTPDRARSRGFDAVYLRADPSNGKRVVYGVGPA